MEVIISTYHNSSMNHFQMILLAKMTKYLTKVHSILCNYDLLKVSSKSESKCVKTRKCGTKLGLILHRAVRGGGGQRGQFVPGPQLKGAPHKKRMKYAAKINSNTLTECTILLFLGPQISKFSRGRMPPDPPNA